MPSEARIFLDALFGGMPDDLYVLLWTLPEKQSHWFRKVDNAIQLAESLHDHDLYVGVGLSGQDHGVAHRCLSHNIAGIFGLWVDIDLRSDAHPNKMLPSTVEEALSILPPELPPTLIVHTGNGIHAWWLFREHWVFQGDEDRKQGAALAKRWNTMLSDNGRMKGWSIDRLGDLARVLRIPGTTNCKDPAHPKPVTIRSHADRRYNPSDFVEFLDELGVSDDDKEDARQQWSQKFQDTPLEIDLDASIPQEKLEPWIASDPRFKSTWFRQRSDLNDQSQSGYDLALACFGFQVGFKEQEIVDLIIQHRRLHRKHSRTRLDYFCRTLSKASQHTRVLDQSGPPPEPGPFVNTMATDSGLAIQNRRLGQSPKSDRKKIDLCKKISAALNVELLRMVRVLGDEPFYRMELAEGSIAFPNVQKLISQTAVKAAIAGKVGSLIPPFKSSHWHTLAQMMLQACFDEDGGEELESQGAARLLIEEYLANNTFILSIEGQSPHDQRNPMVRGDQISVCANHIQNYVNRTKPQHISIHVVVGMLTAVGAKMERVRGKKFKEQSRWMLPLEHFDPADYASVAAGGAV